MKNNNNKSNTITRRPRKRTKARPRKRTNGRYNFKFTAYNESQQPQTYGPGRTFRLLESYVEAFQNSFYNINSLLSASTEHATMKTLYNYMKIYNIALIAYPAMAQNSAGYFTVQLNWNNSDDTNIPFEDNSKVIPVYRTRKYYYKYVPPNIPLLLGDTNSPVVLNLRNYMRTSDSIVIPGAFNFTSEQAFTARIRILMKVEYRGSKVPDSTGLKKLLTMVENYESKRESIKLTEIKKDTENKIVETAKSLVQLKSHGEAFDEENSEYEDDDKIIEEFKMTQ